MPVTIDVTKDLLYWDGIEEGSENKNITVAKSNKRGMSILSVQAVKGLLIDKLEEIVRNLKK